MSAISVDTAQPIKDGNLLSWICQFLPNESDNTPETPDQAFIGILNQCGVAAILLDAQFECVQCTDRAEEMIKSGFPFERQQQRLVCSLAPLAFRRAFLDATQLRRTDLQLEERNGDRCWRLRLVPIRGDNECRCRVLVLIVEDRAIDGCITSRKVRSLLNLTPIESELVADLTNGMSTRAYAETRSVSIHTVRNQLKSVFAKLDVHSQKDMTAHVLKCCITPAGAQQQTRHA